MMATYSKMPPIKIGASRLCSLGKLGRESRLKGISPQVVCFNKWTQTTNPVTTGHLSWVQVISVPGWKTGWHFCSQTPPELLNELLQTQL
jgi:hypothetical protein